METCVYIHPYIYIYIYTLSRPINRLPSGAIGLKLIPEEVFRHVFECERVTNSRPKGRGTSQTSKDRKTYSLRFATSTSVMFKGSTQASFKGRIGRPINRPTKGLYI